MFDFAISETIVACQLESNATFIATRVAAPRAVYPGVSNWRKEQRERHLQIGEEFHLGSFVGTFNDKSAIIDEHPIYTPPH
jgi:hypothetical protein